MQLDKNLDHSVDRSESIMYLSICVSVALGRRLVQWMIIGIILFYITVFQMYCENDIFLSTINNNRPPSWSNGFYGDRKQA